MDNGTSARERVEKELKDLSEKIRKLEDFLKNISLCDKISETQRILLVCQLDLMKAYGRVLDMRLKLWS